MAHIRVLLPGTEALYEVAETEDGLFAAQAQEGTPALTLSLTDLPFSRFRPHPNDPEALLQLVGRALEDLEGFAELTEHGLGTAVLHRLLMERGRIPRDVLLRREYGIYWEAYALEPEGPVPIPHLSRHSYEQTVGYGGSGPAALAENVLRYFSGRPGAYQDFKWQVVANLDAKAEEHRIPAEVVARYLPPLRP